MNKKPFILIALFAALAFLASCSTDDETGIDEEWKAYHQGLVDEVAANPEYKYYTSRSGNGRVYWKRISDFIPDTGDENYDKTLSPQFTDSVHVRYTGWYFYKDGTKYTFDSTEDNGATYKARVGNNIDGWATMLQNMVEGDQVEICVPYMLGYGAYAYNSIPGYTTLWFKMKLLKVIPLDPNRD